MKALGWCVAALVVNGVFCMPKIVSHPKGLPHIRDETLISTSTLSEMIQLGLPNVKIVGAGITNSGYPGYTEEFHAKHIPGARFFDLSECRNKSSPFPTMIPSAQQFADYVGQLGISNNDHVIVYDNKIPISPRVWWMFKVFGHWKVSILEGGLPKWEEDGLATTNETTAITVQSYITSFKPQLVVTFEDMIDNLCTHHSQVVDSRPSRMFFGCYNVTSGPQPGHIPWSINIPFDLFYNSKGLFKTTLELKKLFRDNDVYLHRPMIGTCGAGIVASVVSLAAHLCGVEVPVYDGSWSEYYCRATADQIILCPGYSYTDNC